MSPFQAPPAPPAPPEQAVYAQWVEWGARLGMALSLLTFAIYAFGGMPTQMSPQALTQVWTQPLSSYLKQSGSASS